MVAITIKSFGGVSPKTPARYLQESQAQVALNGPGFAGSLRPLQALGSLGFSLPKSGIPLTIYRYGQDIISDSQYWFHWPLDVDVCRSQIAEDTSEWTFYTGDGAPKATYAAIALGGTEYPFVSRPLGVAPPATAPTLTKSGAPFDANALVETRVYVYTNVSSEAGFDRESSPSKESMYIGVKPGEVVTLSAFDAVPVGYNVTHRRVYRSVSGTFLYVGELLSTDTTFADSVLAEDLEEELPSLTWTAPPDALRGLINLPNGIMAGFVGRDVYFCDPYHPHAWPQNYIQTVDYPVVGLGRMDTTLAVLTTGAPYIIQGTHPDSTAMVKADVEQACVSKRSIASFGGAVFYASPDGLVMLTPGGSRILTESYFTRAQWQSIKPESLHGYIHENKYVGFYDTGTVQGGFVYDIVANQIAMHDIYVSAGFVDLQGDKLFVATPDKAMHIWGTGANKTYTWRSKMFSMPHEMGFSCAQLEAEAYPVTFEVFVDNPTTPAYTLQVTSRRPFRLPVLVGRDWELQLTGATEVFSVAIAQSMQELSGV